MSAEDLPTQYIDASAVRLTQRGLTLLEMLITIAILAIAAATVAPMFSDDSQLRTMGAARILASDIELAQVLTISHPNDPVVVRLEPDKAMYWLAYASDSETPMPRPDNGDPYLVQFGEGRARSTQGVTLALDQISNNMLEFEASGALVDFASSPLIQLSQNGSAITLAVAPMTGSITEHSGTIDEYKKAK